MHGRTPVDETMRSPHVLVSHAVFSQDQCRRKVPHSDVYSQLVVSLVTYVHVCVCNAREEIQRTDQLTRE